MKKYLGPGFIIAIVLYCPFIAILRDPFSSWWQWLGIPGWPVQMIHSNDSFAVIGGTFSAIVTIGLLTYFSASNPKRLFLLSAFTLCYSIGSALLIQSMIHAG